MMKKYVFIKNFYVKKYHENIRQLKDTKNIFMAHYYLADLLSDSTLEL